MTKIAAVTLFCCVTLASFHGFAQTVVQNPTASQSIVQPAGTTFSVTGIQSLEWPNLFRIANEGGGNVVLRDLTEPNAWFMDFVNDGHSGGIVQLFGGFPNHGVLIPNGSGTGSVGTFAVPWGAVYAKTLQFASTRGSRVDVAFLSKGAGQFRIDDPLDPFHKYLQHSFVESPDMKNVYDGIAVLDKQGEAWVSLPDWFQALNADFRYQLTAIGLAGPGLYIAQEVKDNKFKIAGGKPGAKVSWQLTGIRHDAFAKAHRIKVEELKPPDQQGKLLYQDPFGQQQPDIVAQHKKAPRPKQGFQAEAHHPNIKK